VYQLVPGYPEELPRTDNVQFRAFVGHLVDFQASAAAIRAAPVAAQETMARELLDRYPLSQPQSPAIVLELLRIARDHLSFAAVLDMIAHLPDDLAQLPSVLEYQALALGKSNRNPEAIAKLQQLIEVSGATPERHGLLGGRYKDLWRAAVRQGNRTDARRYLTKAIDHYCDGMWLDLNEYYCASNLPRLLRNRAAPGDTELARQAADITRHACERAERLGKHDEWLEATLLGAAFDSGDADQAERLLDRIIDGDPSAWKLDSTLSDLRASLSEQAATLDGPEKDRLGAVLTELERCAAPNVSLADEPPLSQGGPL
jgi:tetratricopeptide (TPR) repeat protein